MGGKVLVSCVLRVVLRLEVVLRWFGGWSGLFYFFSPCPCPFLFIILRSIQRSIPIYFYYSVFISKLDLPILNI